MTQKSKIETALSRLKGQMVHYNNEIHLLKYYELDDERERVFIHFESRGSLDRPYESAMKLIEMIELIPSDSPLLYSATTKQQPRIQPPMSKQQEQCLTILGDNDLLDTAARVVKNTFAKFEDGSINLEQAASLNDSIKALIDLEKTKVAKSAMAFKILGID